MEHDGTVSAKLWKEIEAVFEEVVGLPPEERDEMLDRFCSTRDPEFRSLVMERLEAEGETGDVHEGPLHDDPQNQNIDAFAGAHHLRTRRRDQESRRQWKRTAHGE